MLTTPANPDIENTIHKIRRIPLLLLHLFLLVMVLGFPLASAQDSPEVVAPPASELATAENTGGDDDSAGEQEEFKVFEYGLKGLDIRSRDGNYHAHIDWRGQFRFTSRDFDDPIAPDPDEREGDFSINRARFKLGGHAYRPWLGYYFEFDFTRSVLLTLQFTPQVNDALRFKVGQWKVPYNRERVDSSGKQQFVERSIATPYFTIDRQQGAAVFGRLRDETAEVGKRRENRIRLQWDISF